MSDPDADMAAYLRAEQVANDYHPAADPPVEITVLHSAAALLRTGPEVRPFAAAACARLLEEVARARHQGHPVGADLARAADEIAHQVVGTLPPPAS